MPIDLICDNNVNLNLDSVEELLYSSFIKNFIEEYSSEEVSAQKINKELKINMSDLVELIVSNLDEEGYGVAKKIYFASTFVGMIFNTDGEDLLVTVRHYEHGVSKSEGIVEYYVSVHGASDTVSSVVEKLNLEFNQYVTIGISWAVKGKHGIEIQHIALDGSEPPTDEFYPWLKRGMDPFIKAYNESNSSILILYGPPGTGKTSFLKHLLISLNYKSIVSYDDDILKSDGLFTTFINGEYNSLIIEDADNLLKDRKKETNPFMSRFLNVSEGLIKVAGKKVIFTTNLEKLDNIDPALIRPGRCFGVINFRNLTSSEADAAARSVGIKRDFTSKPEWTLAELFTQDNGLTEVVESNRMGFV